jgi:sulfate permease, SulP family
MKLDDEPSTGLRVPVLEGVLPIERSQLPNEIVAGVTLAALAIPEVMGYTKIAGMPVITGLYTMLIPMALFAVFGSSRHLVVGADSATAAILAAGLVGVAATDSEQYVALAGVLALLAGGFLILARIIGLGFMADFLSRTVLIGFLTGVGVQVALGQVGGMLGLANGGQGVVQQVRGVVAQIDQLNLHALGIAIGALAVTVGCKRLSRRVPGALLAVVSAIVASWVFDWSADVHVLGSVPGGLPRLGLPHVAWNIDLIATLLPTAFSMFVVILAQSAATSRAYAARYNEQFSEDTDLVGLAFANVGASLSGAFVVNGSPTKTQMVDSAGGRTQLSLLVAAGVVVVVLLLLTPPLAYLPEAVLSAVVFLIGIDLIDVAGMRRIYAERRSEFWVATTTAAMVVLVGVGEGILLAIVLSLIDHTRRGYRPRNVVVVPAAAGPWRVQPLATAAQAAPGLLIYRFTHSMYYANCEQLTRELTDLVRRANPPLSWFCIDAAAVDDVDFSAAETLRSLVGLLQSHGVKLVVAQVLDDVASEGRSHFKALFGEGAFFDSLDEVLRAYVTDQQRLAPA